MKNTLRQNKTPSVTLYPLADYSAPRYPNRREVDLDRVLLRHRPRRWAAGSAALLMAGALTAVSLTAASLSGCVSSTGEFAPTSEQSGILNGGGERYMRVAPIFEGTVESAEDGIGKIEELDPSKIFNVDISDILLNGKVRYEYFLSEESALAIIIEALSEKGLTAVETEKKVDVKIGKKSSSWTFDLEITGAAEPIYIEYVGGGERELDLKEREKLGLLEGTTKENAVSLISGLSGVKDESTAAVFHDGDRFFASSASLRAQVAEFVEWLTTAGLI